ncbi:inositol polyphosphate 1-phosphatase-like [Liolophura sinensis]|uniref:inositol polyphosphate 1-phosphatase-like n=1 Tax=Liolophura sinensis TaxID=3198878 RepID=UPI003158D93F
MDVVSLTKALISTAEKGANIARVIRAEEELLSLLVEEKSGQQKNDRFVNDFKTLADVLVQEVVRHDLSKQFPGIERNFHGEESSKFTNTMGESILVEVKATREETCALLETILDGNRKAAELLSEAVHADINTSTELPIRTGQHCLPVHMLGLWIDPIDSTAQYISGENGLTGEDGLTEHGLQNVLVLIGVYDQLTGQPLIGVTNQPFHKYNPDTDRWAGRSEWGVSIGNLQVNSLSQPVEVQSTVPRGIVMLSSSEDPQVEGALKAVSQVTYASGAGYKILVTVLGLVDAYVISKSTTYKWDVCGPHAIMKSRGGGVVRYSKATQLFKEKAGQLTESDLCELQVRYATPDKVNAQGAKMWCNEGGIIVYSEKTFLLKLLEKLSAL